MKHSRLGRTGVVVTELGFGAAPIGNLHRAVGDGAARRAVAAAWDGGIRYFDTAPHYGLGLSERRLGQALSGFPRGDFAISTKVGRLLVPNPVPTGCDLESGGFAVDDALTRLRTVPATGCCAASDRASSASGSIGSTSCTCTIPRITCRRRCAMRCLP